MTTEIDESKVLVVDDEPALANVLRDVLLTEGYHVRTAAEGATEVSSRRKPFTPPRVGCQLEGGGQRSEAFGPIVASV